VEFVSLLTVSSLIQVRISTKPDGPGAKGLAWHHAKCLVELSPSIQVDKLSGWNSLSSSDQSAVSDFAKKCHPMNKGGMVIDMFNKVWFLLP